MPITRTPIIDDSGSGKDGTVIDNAWKQQLYDQIDALVSDAAPLVSWVPVDASGAGLVFSGSTAKYSVGGKVVFISGSIFVPANASSAMFKVGGLPFPAAMVGGVYQIYGLTQSLHISEGTTNIIAFNPTSLAQRTNADMSGAALMFSGFYFKA